MKKIRQKLPAVFLILLAVLFIPCIANAKTKEYQGDLWNFKKTIKKTSGAFTYYAYPSKNQKEAWIYKIDIKGGKNCSKLSIPSKLDKKKVTRLGSREIREREDEDVYNIFDVGMEPWHPYNNGEYTRTKRIKKLIIPNTVKIIQPVAFAGMDSLTEVKIPKSVKTLEEYIFYHCDKLKKAELPAGLKSMDTMAFKDCPKLKELKLSSKNKTYQVKDNCVFTKKKKELIFAAGGRTIRIPEGVKIIKEYAFRNCIDAAVHIPASVEKIEKKAFEDPYGYENICVENVTIDEKNNIYARDGQCIYNKTDKSLSVAIWDIRGNLIISDQVERLTEDISSIGPEPLVGDGYAKVVYPKHLKTVVDNGFLGAEKVYFTGGQPPKLVTVNRKKVTLPTSHVYVPQGAEEIYRQWYKSNKSYNQLSGFETFQPGDRDKGAL